MPDKFEKMLTILEPVDLQADISGLSDGDRAALQSLKGAIYGIDTLYRRQFGDHAVEMGERLEEKGEWQTSFGKAFRYHNLPYDTLNNHAPFDETVPAATPGKALYPADLTEEAFEDFIAKNPEDKEALTSPYTAVAEEGHKLMAIPYHIQYREDLRPVIEGLLKASMKVEHKGLKRFLEKRAKALAGEYDILDSDADWVKMTDAPLEVVIGPFEVYEDGLKGLKAFYEAMLLIIDHEAGQKLKQIEDALDIIGQSVPTPEGSKPAFGGMAPLIVADELLAGGEGRSGILTSAFNLPNDPGVRGKVGWKQVMIRNVMQAKFNACTSKIAERVLTAEDFKWASFDSYFFHVLLHEVSHGLGPAYRADGSKVNEVCGKYYTAIEEAKADSGALVLLMKFNGEYGIPQLAKKTIAASYFAGLYRSIRFGLHEAHGKANVIQYTFMKDKGALVEKEGALGVDEEKLEAAGVALLDELTRLQAAGSMEELKAFSEKYGRVPEELEQAVERLSDLPIDILPTYPLERD